jgi:hypothetical protein
MSAVIDRRYSCGFHLAGSDHLIAFHDFLRRDLPGKLCDLFDAFANQSLPESLIGEDCSHAARDIENVLRVHKHGGILENLRQ